MIRSTLYLLLATLSIAAARGDEPAQTPPPDPRYRIGALLFHDDFTHGLDQWAVELEQGGTVQAHDGKLVLDVPAGCTCWFKPQLAGPVLIRYDATAVRAGGPNDRVSDLNCFWMAQDAANAAPPDVPADHRSGKFSAYDTLRTYYVGLGGNGNTTSRFRRYVGEPGHRPLLPEHDLQDAPHLLTANARQTLSLVACGGLIQFFRDADRMFEMHDAEPYTAGWFGLRTVSSHLEVTSFRVYRLEPVAAPAPANPR